MERNRPRNRLLIAPILRPWVVACTCCLGYALRMAHQHSQADDKVAEAISENFHEQTRGRKHSDDINFGLLAESAMDAVLDYESELNQEYIDSHPGCLDDVDEVLALRKSIAASIRNIPCVYEGTSAIAFKSARELAARVAENDEQV